MINDPRDNQYNADHVAMWVRLHQAMGLNPEAIRGEIDRCTLGDVTMIYEAQHGRTIPTEWTAAGTSTPLVVGSIRILSNETDIPRISVRSD